VGKTTRGNKMNIIRRRYIAQELPVGSGKTIVIDIRSNAGIPEAQSLANAEDFAQKKLKAKSIRVRPPLFAAEQWEQPDYLIGLKKSE
jgi:hypothetical protein